MSKERLVEAKTAKAKDQALIYYDRYRDQIDLLEHSTLAKIKGKVDIYDVYALGKQLEQYDTMTAICEEVGNTALLGVIPNIAYDVITAVHGASVIPIMASVQPIEDEQGIVYFKTVRTTDVRGSQTTAGDVVTDPRVPIKYQEGYASNSLTHTEVGTGATTMTINLPIAPIRGQTLRINGVVTATQLSNGVQGADQGPRDMTDTSVGIIWGDGVSGNVDYDSGIVSLTFAVALPATEEAQVTYQQNFEANQDLPQVDMYFDSQAIHAKMYALKGTIGLLQSYGMQKRFGKIAEDEMSKDLVQEINKEIGGDIIRMLAAAAVGTTTFSRTLPAGTSDFDHRQSYKFKLADSEALLAQNSGRGTISLLIVGSTHASLIQTLPGFERISDGNTLGMHIFGTLDGIPVIRVVQQNLLGPEDGIALWKGTSPWEAAVVYSPFMPLTMTDLLPMAPNPLLKMRAAAVWAGVDVIVPQYATRFNVIP